jgi:hypothetical protein
MSLDMPENEQIGLKLIEDFQKYISHADPVADYWKITAWLENTTELDNYAKHQLKYTILGYLRYDKADNTLFHFMTQIKNNKYESAPLYISFVKFCKSLYVVRNTQ